MLFKGYSKRFSLKNNDQYNTIGEYWDYFSDKYGLENLRGLGLNWENGSMEYIIGLKDNSFIECDIEGAIYKEVFLPCFGWLVEVGKTLELEEIYNKIYEVSTLIYEIETFNLDGSCKIEFIRNVK